MNRWLLTTALVVVLSLLAPTVAQDWCYNFGVSITETEIQNDVTNVIYISSEIIFVQTDGYQTYRSGDEGKSWELLTTPAQDAFRYVVPSANSSMIYFSTFSWTTQFYTSIDGGATLIARTSFPKDYFVEDIKPHPTLAEWALARMSPKNCQSTFCHEELYYTNDFGITWYLIESYVSSTYQWGETILNYEDPSNNHILIFYQTTNNKNGTQDPGLPLLKRYDVLFNSINEVIFSGVNNFFKLPYNDSLLFLTREDPQVNVQLLISEDGGDTWAPAIFPFQLPFNGIEILDGSEGAVLVNILHDDTSPYGNVYISDAYTSEYSLVLKNNIRSGTIYDFYSASDFIKVENLHGIYLANVYAEIENQVSLKKVKTLVTFDFGGEWTRINPPVNDSNGQPIQCNPGEQCYLNLNGLLENAYGSFYSSPDAIGVLLATGNVGEYLSTKPSEFNTYMSRDAGWSWIEIAKGSLAYEMGDQGGILLFAENSQPTNTLLYTWTEGLTFTECMFTNGSDVDITNIVVEPSYTSEKFLMYGSRGSKGILIHVDFSGVQPRPCQNPEMAGTNSSDYELWSPSDLMTDDSTTECLLGAHRVYTRRKRDAECFNPPTYTPKVTVTGCACTIEDYDCDYCWETNEDYACTYVCLPPYDEVPVPCDDYYYVTQGYRRIPGDNCNASAGLNLLPQLFECPKPSVQSSSMPRPKHTGVIVAAILVTVVVLVLVVGGFVSWKLKKPSGLWKKKETNYTMVATDEFEETCWIVEEEGNELYYGRNR